VEICERLNRVSHQGLISRQCLLSRITIVLDELLDQVVIADRIDPRSVLRLLDQDLVDLLLSLEWVLVVVTTSDFLVQGFAWRDVLVLRRLFDRDDELVPRDPLLDLGEVKVGGLQALPARHSTGDLCRDGALC